MTKQKWYCIWESKNGNRCPRQMRRGFYCNQHAKPIRRVELKTKPTKRFIRQMERFAKNRTAFDLTIKGDTYNVINNHMYQNDKMVCHFFDFVRRVGGNPKR